MLVAELLALIGQVSAEDAVAAVPWLGATGGAVYAFSRLLHRWDERDARNVEELWRIVESYRGRAERAEAELARYVAVYGPMTSDGHSRG